MQRLELLISKVPQDQLYYIEDPVDLYYLTGLKLSKGRMLVGNKTSLFVDGRYFFAAKATFPESVEPLEKLETCILESHRKTLCFDQEKTSYARYMELEKLTSRGILLKPIESPLASLRQIKSAQEILLIEKSAAINQQALQNILPKIAQGVTEQELAKEFMIQALKLGAEKMAFDPIVAFGENTALAHHRASARQLRLEDPILIDVGVMYQNYASDITRTFFYKKSSQKLLKLREQVIHLQKKIVAMVRPGVSIRDLAMYAKNAIENMGPYQFIHSLGHGLGLEVHEMPKFSLQEKEDQKLQPGMVITIEPGVYIEGLGGFRHEDLLVVTQTGCKNLYENFAPAMMIE